MGRGVNPVTVRVTVIITVLRARIAGHRCGLRRATWLRGRAPLRVSGMASGARGASGPRRGGCGERDGAVLGGWRGR